MSETPGTPVVIEAGVTGDAGEFALTIRLVADSVGQAFVVRDHKGSPIFTVGPFGGPVAWGDRLGASPRVFGPELVIDGGISVPALAYLMSADLGNYRTAPHHWVCQTGVPSTTLANLTNNSGEYVACQPGDRYSRIDAPMQPGAREYICVAAGEPEAGSTAGLWESLL
jgi:hypothetical protein